MKKILCVLLIVLMIPFAAAESELPDRSLKSATIRFAGDFVIHEPIFKSAERLARSGNSAHDYDFAPMLDPIRAAMRNADFTVTNIDGCLGKKDLEKYRYSGYPAFVTPHHILYALKDASVDMLTLANNHMLDIWYSGLMNTIDNAESFGFHYIGASRTQEERNTPVILEVNGIRIGFLNYTKDLNSMDRQASLDKRAMQFAVHAIKNSDCMADAKRLKEAGADVIVCYMHWGTEYEPEPDQNQKAYAEKLVEAGVDVIVGGHPHVVQRAEWLRGVNQFGETQETLCLYSLGNFLSFQRSRYRDGGIIFEFTVREQADGSFRIVEPGYLPTWVWVTGAREKYDFKVLNIADFIENRPEGMTDKDFQQMMESYRDSIAAMSKGVGELLLE
ncbi:MAG: CapA family protein [Clostridia bacterium]|nr:CapA family protein [Clostridia bacterium]